MVSKNGNKLKFSVESLLEPRVTATSNCHSEAINPAISPSSVPIIAGQGRQFGIMKTKLDHAPQGTKANIPPCCNNMCCFLVEAIQVATINSNGESVGTDCTKPKKGRMRFSQEQIQALEKRFQEQHYLVPADRKILAFALRMSERQVKTWFQNRRAQYKRSKPLVRCPQLHHIKPTYRFTMDTLIPTTFGALSNWNCAIQRIATSGNPLPTAMPTPSN